MKKAFLILIMLIGLTSFKTTDSFPCHPLGDLYPCTHPMHALGDLGICTHTYVDMWGNIAYQHNAGDVYPCSHPAHSAGDLYSCTHICF